MVFLAAVSAAVVLAACSNGSSGGGNQGGNPFVAAWIYVGSPSDAGWTQQHDLGRQAVQNAFGNKVKTIFKENVPEGPQVTSVINQLVNQGAKIIFSTSFGFQNAIVQGAKKYPNVKFEQATGTALAPN